jgi:riboflavin kinase/FMN adenylyltransferase
MMRVFMDQGPGGARVLALGTFDGVHRGHQALLQAGKKYAREHGILLRACSFDRHPLEVLCPGKAPEQLTTAAEKERLMAAYGVDELQLLHFTREMADMAPEDFLKMLRESVDLKAVVAGWNYTFGRGGRGNAETLKQDGAKRGYDVIIVPPVKTEEGEVISSTLIRETMKQGRISDAEKLLGHFLEGNRQNMV